MKTVILDNYDSFTYNLYQYIAELGGNPVVYRNDELSLVALRRLKPTHIVISPGPGTPVKKKDFGICGDVIKKLGSKIPILGVCLGHQGIISVFGGSIIRAPEIMHGKTSIVKKTPYKSRLFKGLPDKFEAMRYHSLVGAAEKIPDCLAVTARTAKDGLVMAVEHRKFPIFGIQFHPESIGTKVGKMILKNFLQIHA